MPILEAAPLLVIQRQKRTDIDSYYGASGNFGHLIHSNLGSTLRVGESNPGYRVQIAKKIDATTPYTSRRFTVTPLSARAKTVTAVRIGKIDEGAVVSTDEQTLFPRAFNPTAAHDLQLQNLALSRLKRKLSSNIGDYQGLVPLVELKDMRSLIRNTARLSTTMLKSLIDIKRTRGRSAFKWASSAWLNFSFGVKPLISETQSLSESIASYLARNDHTVRLTGYSSKDWSSSYVASYTGAYGAPLNLVYTDLHQLSYRYSGAMNLEISAANNYGIVDHFGFEFAALPSVAWELIPYSWVVDYFSNFGEYLEDRFTSPPGTLVFLCLSKRYKISTVLRGYYNGNKGTSASQSIQPGASEATYLERTKLATLPHIGLHLKTSDQIGSFAVTKLLNLASLLIK